MNHVFGGTEGAENVLGGEGRCPQTSEGQHVEEGVDGSVLLRGTELGLVTKGSRELVSHH